MIEKLCKELKLYFCGRWDDAGALMFRIDNPTMVAYGASFTVFDGSKQTIVQKMNEVETNWINLRRKEERKHAL